MKPEDKMRAGLPATIRDVRRPSVYDFVPPEGRAAIDQAGAFGAVNRLTRQMDTVVQRMEDHIAYVEELKRERRRRGR